MTDIRANNTKPTSEERELNDGPSGALWGVLLAFVVITGTIFGFGIYHLTTFN